MLEKKILNDRSNFYTDHIIAFTESLAFYIKKIGGLKSKLYSGEGLVVEFYDTGTLWIQTRSQSSFLKKDNANKHLRWGDVI